MGINTAYDTDFYAWTQEQARLLRMAQETRVNQPLDYEHLAEELEDMGNNKKNAVHSALVRVIEHLLKLEHSPATDPRAGWRESVIVHRIHIRDALEDSPSLRGKIDLAKAFRDGRKLAAIGLERDGMKPEDLPAECPYALEQALDEDWWPPVRQGAQ